jgi:putative tricarboxylic transport membrane protein
MKRPYQITAVLCILFAAFVLRQSLALRLYTSMGPGPGFFPFWLAILFAGLALIMLGQAIFARSDPRPADFFATRTGYLRIAAIVGSLAGTVLLLDPLGFRLTTLAFYLVLLNVLSRQSWLVTLVIAVAGSFGVYYVFAEVLRIPLPVGLLGV